MFTCMMMALCYNICLSVDLFVTLYYPFISGNYSQISSLSEQILFQSGKQRMGYYHCFALMSTAVIVTLSEQSFFGNLILFRLHHDDGPK